MSRNNNAPYRLYLTEDQMPKQYYNLRADMKELPEPLLNPATKKPVTLDELSVVFCRELARQELDNETRYLDIPKEILDMYRIYRPSPLIRAYNLEKYLDTPAKIYYKFEGNNTSGSHKLNSAIAQVYYAKQEGITSLTTETGAGQWGTALAEACSYFGIPLTVFMVKGSYQQKPFRKDVMRTFGAEVIPSPSNTTEVGRKILSEIKFSVERGESFASLVAKEKFPPLYVGLIVTGEAGGELVNMLRQCESMADFEVEEILHTLPAKAEIFGTLIAGLIVATLVFAVMLPILDTTNLL